MVVCAASAPQETPRTANDDAAADSASEARSAPAASPRTAAVAQRNEAFAAAMAQADCEHAEFMQEAGLRIAAVSRRNKRYMYGMGIGSSSTVTRQRSRQLQLVSSISSSRNSMQQSLTAHQSADAETAHTQMTARITRHRLRQLEHAHLIGSSSTTMQQAVHQSTAAASVPTYGETSSGSTRTADSETLHPFHFTHSNVQRVSSYYVELRIPAVLDFVELSKPLRWSHDSPLLLAEKFQVAGGDTFKRPIYNRRDFAVPFKNLLILYESDVSLCLGHGKCVWTGPLVSSEGSMHVPMYHKLVHNIRTGMAVIVLLQTAGHDTAGTHNYTCYTGTVLQWMHCASSSSNDSPSKRIDFPSFRYTVCIQLSV